MTPLESVRINNHLNSKQRKITEYVVLSTEKKIIRGAIIDPSGHTRQLKDFYIFN